jgi:plastocyanin
MTSTQRSRGFSLIWAMLVAMPSFSAMAYEETEVTDGAVIEGRVTYEGRIPSRRIVPTSDREICGGIREWQLVERDADNGIKSAVVYLEAVERGKPWGETQREVPVMDNLDCMFEPYVLVMKPGEIDIHNSDDVLHNTKAYYGRRAVFNLALPEAGMTIRRELTRPGTVRFECDAHGWMEGWAYVLTHPYYALTAEDGSFRITDVPPGEYTLITRHEHIGEVQQTLQVGAGETAQLSIELTQ